MWNAVPSYVFSKTGGLRFLLVCSYNVSKISIKLSNIHRLRLLSWSLIFKHKFPKVACLYTYMLVLLAPLLFRVCLKNNNK